MKVTCKYCNREYIYVRDKGHKKTYCNSCGVNRRRFGVKRKMVSYKGGKCIRCGYNRCLRALEFHHRNPNEKDLAISRSYCRRWEVIRQELDKCDLLCSNCHREIHDELEGCPYDRDLEVPVRKERASRNCRKCGAEFLVWSKDQSFCSKGCYDASRDRSPDKSTLEKLVWSMPSTKLAKRLGVSDSAIVKWCKKHGIKKPSRGYWQQSRNPRTPNTTCSWCGVDFYCKPYRQSASRSGRVFCCREHKDTAQRIEATM